MIDYLLKKMDDIPSCDLEDLIDIKKFSMKDVVKMNFASKIGTSVFVDQIFVLPCLYGYLVGNGLFHRKGSHPVVYKSSLLYIENDQNEVIFAVRSPDDKRIQEFVEFLEDRTIVGIIVMKYPMSRSVINDFKRIMLELGIFKDQTEVYTFHNIIYYLSEYTEIRTFVSIPSRFSSKGCPFIIDAENVEYLYQEFIKAFLNTNESTFEHCRSLCCNFLSSLGNYFDVTKKEDFKKYHHLFMKISNNDYIKSKEIIHKIFITAYKSNMNQPSAYRSGLVNSDIVYILTEYIQ